MFLKSARKAFLRVLSVALGALAVHSVMAQQFQPTVLHVVLNDSHRNVAVPGVLTLTSEGLSFDSTDVIFQLPVAEIKKLEFQGTRKGFATFAIESKSSLISQQMAILLRRDDAYRQPEAILIVSLSDKEDLAKALSEIKQYQSVVQAAKDAQAKTIIGDSVPAAGANAAYPFIGKTIRVHVLKGGIYGSPVHGFLTFFEDRVQFASEDVTFSVPLKLIEKVECAGARETFLSLNVSSKTEFARHYEPYLRDRIGYSIANRDGQDNLDFKLDEEEDVRQSFATATQFQNYMNDYLAGKVRSMVAAASAVQSSDAQSSSQAPQTDQVTKQELYRLNSEFIEKYTPHSAINAFKLITGVRGKTVIFDSGIGYVSDETQPRVKVSRQQYFQDGHLKFFLPSSAISSVADASAIRNPSNSSVNAYIAEIAVDRNSEFFKNHGALMAESNKDNLLYLMFPNQSELQRCISSLNKTQNTDQF